MRRLYTTVLFLLIGTVAFSQDVIVKLLSSTETEVIKHMHDNLKAYELQPPDTSSVKYLEFILQSDSVKTGVLVYLFYFENPFLDRCTSIRLIFYDETIFKNAVKQLTYHFVKVNVFQWHDPKNNLQISTFFAKGATPDDSFYFMDISPL